MLIAHSEWVHHSGKAQPPADVRQGLLNSAPQQGTLGPLPEATERAGNVATALLSPPGPIVRIRVLWGRFAGHSRGWLRRSAAFSEACFPFTPPPRRLCGLEVAPCASLILGQGFTAQITESPNGFCRDPFGGLSSQLPEKPFGILDAQEKKRFMATLCISRGSKTDVSLKRPWIGSQKMQCKPQCAPDCGAGHLKSSEPWFPHLLNWGI